MIKIKNPTNRVFFVAAIFLLATGISYAAGIPPTAPNNLKAMTIGNEVEFTWSPSLNDDGLVLYNIYVDDKYIDTVAANSYRIPVVEGQQVSFYIYAHDPIPRNFTRSEEITHTVQTTISDNDNSSPSAPGNLIGDVDNGRVTIAWNASSDNNGVTAYDVYRDGVIISSTSASKTWYSEANAPDQVRTWRVKARDARGNESEFSRLITLPEFIVSSGPTRPTSLTGSVSNGRMNIQWLASSDDKGVGYYEVYLNGDKVAEVTTPGYSIDSTTSDPQTWKIKAFDDDGNESDFSEELTIEDRGAGPQFSLQVRDYAYGIIEGNRGDTSIPIEVLRSANFSAPIQLSVSTLMAVNPEQLTTRFSTNALTVSDDISWLKVRLGIGNVPRLPREIITLLVTASSAGITQEATVTLLVTPTPFDDVYLLVGQSNMVGFSGSDTKKADAGEPDEPNPRILQPNIKANYADNTFSDNIYHNDVERFLESEDPLHRPKIMDSEKGSFIGMGLSFAKAALPYTSQNIYLVPAAMPSSSFCDSSERGHWNPKETDNPVLGNTALYDRAIRRVNETLIKTRGVLRGILWHQGESDSNSRCARFYEENIIALAKAMKTDIVQDFRGPAARGPEADIPFVVGTMSKGQDERGDYANFDQYKAQVDAVHRNINSLVRFSAVTNNDDLVPSNGYPCGNGDCIHFGPEALREMGFRTYKSLLRAAAGN